MTEYLDRYPTMHEYAEGKRINPKMTDLISRADAIEEISKGVWNVHELIDRINALPSADTIEFDFNKYQPRVRNKVCDDTPSADTVSREEYEELYRKAKEVNEMANDILADFPSYKELVSADAVSIHEDGTLEVKVANAHKVGRVLVTDVDSHIGGGLFYPDETVQGEWIEVEDDYDNIYWECSNCEDAFVLEVGTPKDNNYNFCPSCGARMYREDGEA